MEHRARRIACAATSLAVAGFVVVFALSFVPLPPPALLEHFRIQLAAGGLVVAAAAGGLAFGAQWLDARWFDAAMFALLLDACILAPELSDARRELPEGAAVRVLVVNVLTENTGSARLQQLIAEEQPDVIGLVEVDARWLRELAPALAPYPSRIEAPRNDNFGLALYARGPLTGGVEHLGSDRTAIASGGGTAIVAETAHGGARLGIVLVHPIPPLNGALYDRQLRHFDAVAARARGFAVPFLIMGDFNATPWSRAFARLRGASGTCDSRAGFGAQTSYPADGWLLRIPIDHVLVACSIGVRDRRIGPPIGSDHLPVIVDLVVPR